MEILIFTGSFGPGSVSLNLWPHHLKSLRRPRVLNSAHASDQVQRIPIQFSFLQVRVVNMNRNNLSDHQAAAGGRGREVENLMELALKADRRFADSWRPHELRRFWSELGQVEFVHRRVVFATG